MKMKKRIEEQISDEAMEISHLEDDRKETDHLIKEKKEKVKLKVIKRLAKWKRKSNAREWASKIYWESPMEGDVIRKAWRALFGENFYPLEPNNLTINCFVCNRETLYLCESWESLRYRSFHHICRSCARKKYLDEVGNPKR